MKPLPPKPTLADRIEGERFVAETYDADPTVSRQWLADRRATLVRYAADAAMQTRLQSEHRARFDVVKAGQLEDVA